MRGDFEQRQKGDLVFTVWLDKAPIYFLSTCISPVDSTSISRRDEEGKVEEMKCPTVVAEYNQYVHGVDTVNQLRQSYPIGRSSRKWYRSIVWWLIDIAIINAYTLAGLKNKNKWKNHLGFRIELMKELAKWQEKRGEEAFSQREEDEEQAVGHYPFLFNTARVCRYCSSRSKKKPHRVESKYGCKVCDVHLCVYPCFGLYHQKEGEDQ